MKRNLVLKFITAAFLLTLLTFSVSAEESYPVEEYYFRSGAHQVSTASYESGVFGYGEYKAWYPSDMSTTNKKYPVIVYCNGTTTTDSIPYTVDLMNLLASHGFIALSNDHAMSGNGDSASAELDFFLALDSQKNSLFYGKIDRNRIGICGHSQGGSAVFNAVSEGKYSNSHMFKSACAISAPTAELASSLVQNTPYDSAKVTVPTFLISGTTLGETAICPLDRSLMANLDAINNSNVVMGRITGADHLDTQDEGSAYITAWFRWTLCGDSFAAGAFTGENPELYRNGKWQDVLSKEMLSSTDTDGDASGGINLPSMDEIGNVIDYIKGIIVNIIGQLIERIKEILM